MTELIGTELSERAVDFLKDECNRLQALYSQAQDNAQNIFNFYLTFISTIVGALIVLLQVSGFNSLQSKISVAGLLFFAAVVGTVYLSAISGRYAHLTRYAYAIDELRRYLIRRLQIPMPAIYDSFLSEDTPVKKSVQRSDKWYVWLVPMGTYTMFISIISSLSLAMFTWVVLSLGDISAEYFVFAGMLVFLLTLTIYNAYSRIFVDRVSQRLHVRIDSGRELAVWAGKN
ncbi:MAG: hypothetical protein U0694_24735 [Anaerolineae bacterium]